MSEISILRLAERIPDEAAAYQYLEELRWGGTSECPHCGSTDRCYFLTPKNGAARKTRTGAATQRRLWKCGACRKQFSVLTGTVMHGTKIPVRTWVFVLFEMVSSKNGVSAREIERKYDVTPRSAWFLTHRIREAMKRGGLTTTTMRGTIVADETYVGGQAKNRHAKDRDGIGGRGTRKQPVFSLVNTETGEVRSKVIPDVSGMTLRKAIEEHVDPLGSVLHTDGWAGYVSVGRQFDRHETVDHGRGEYVRDGVSTNVLEGFFSQLQRSIDGTHHHVSVEHLDRYLAEFDYRYTTRKMSDTQRLGDLLGRVGGRRLTYRRVASQGARAAP